jgi:hypothetical protein
MKSNQTISMQGNLSLFWKKNVFNKTIRNLPQYQMCSSWYAFVLECWPHSTTDKVHCHLLVTTVTIRITVNSVITVTDEHSTNNWLSYRIQYILLLLYTLLFWDLFRLPRPPLWSSGQTSWLLTQRSRRYQIFWVAVGLERGPLSPCESKWGVTWKKSSGSGLKNWD